jgi:hypothetical protein
MSENKGEIWIKCGRCRGIGTVPGTSGPAITCPECGGSGTRRAGKIKQDKNPFTGSKLPGQFTVDLDTPLQLDLDKFNISISMVPNHLPTSPRTGKTLALYEINGPARTISCVESKTTLKLIRDYVFQEDITRLDEACPDHQHENLLSFEREISEPSDWNEVDEVGAETIYGKIQG